MPINPADHHFMQRALDLAEAASSHGSRPFAALIVVGRDRRVEMPGLVDEYGDPTAHAEMEAIREFVRRYSASDLLSATLYTVVEPCPMCAGAIYYAGLKRLVYSVSRVQFDRHVARCRGRSPKKYQSCRGILCDGGLTELDGPVLEEQGLAILRAHNFAQRELEPTR